MLSCCEPLEAIQERGISLHKLACLAACNGTSAIVTTASANHEGDGSVAEFREAVRANVQSDGSDGFILLSYCRSGLGQTGTGHFSPLAGYHAGTDSVLILDVARFKYPPHWVSLEQLHRSMHEHQDPDTGRNRGWILVAKKQLESSGTTAGGDTLLLRLARARWSQLSAMVAVMQKNFARWADDGPSEGEGDTPPACECAEEQAVECMLESMFGTPLGSSAQCGRKLLPVQLGDLVEHWSGYYGIENADHDVAAARETLLGDIRTTRVYRAVCNLAEKNRQQKSGESGEADHSAFGGLASEEVALLVFVVAGVVALPSAIRCQSLLSGKHLPPALQREVAVLRRQLRLVKGEADGTIRPSEICGKGCAHPLPQPAGQCPP